MWRFFNQKPVITLKISEIRYKSWKNGVIVKFHNIFGNFMKTSKNWEISKFRFFSIWSTGIEDFENFLNELKNSKVSFFVYIFNSFNEYLLNGAQNFQKLQFVTLMLKIAISRFWNFLRFSFPKKCFRSMFNIHVSNIFR